METMPAMNPGTMAARKVFIGESYFSGK
jgi:hypothetical protein